MIKITVEDTALENFTLNYIVLYPVSYFSLSYIQTEKLKIKAKGHSTEFQQILYFSLLKGFIFVCYIVYETYTENEYKFIYKKMIS